MIAEICTFILLILSWNMNHFERNLARHIPKAMCQHPSSPLSELHTSRRTYVADEKTPQKEYHKLSFLNHCAYSEICTQHIKGELKPTILWQYSGLLNSLLQLFTILATSLFSIACCIAPLQGIRLACNAWFHHHHHHRIAVVCRPRACWLISVQNSCTSVLNRRDEQHTIPLPFCRCRCGEKTSFRIHRVKRPERWLVARLW